MPVPRSPLDTTMGPARRSGCIFGFMPVPRSPLDTTMGPARRSGCIFGLYHSLLQPSRPASRKPSPSSRQILFLLFLVQPLKYSLLFLLYPDLVGSGGGKGEFAQGLYAGCGLFPAGNVETLVISCVLLICVVIPLDTHPYSSPRISGLRDPARALMRSPRWPHLLASTSC